MARRKSSVGKKSLAKAKQLSVPEKIEENETGENDSEAADEIQADTERQISQDNPTNLERNASRGQASVPSRQNSLTASQSKGNLLGARKETDLQRTSRTSLSKRTSTNFSEHQKEETIITDMARAYGTTHLKDTPNHLYGLDGALISSDEDGDIDVDDPLKENDNHLGGRIKCFVKDHWKRALSGFTIFLLTGVLFAFIIQASPHWPFSAKTEIDPNSEMLRKIEEKVDRLSSVLQLLANNTDSSSNDKSVISEQAVQEIVQAALERYNADKVGMADFALESSGAQIHGSYHSATYEIGAARVVLFGIPLWFDIKPPRVILQPDNSPGNCWAFKGDNGFVVIKLSKMVTPTAFSLEHIPKLLSPTGDGRIPSAPKEFTVWGWKDETGNERVKLGYYIFDNEGEFLQTFNIQRIDESEVIQYIELRILSNHGNPQYTCIYRFRVHGQPH